MGQKNSLCLCSQTLCPFLTTAPTNTDIDVLYVMACLEGAKGVGLIQAVFCVYVVNISLHLCKN